MIRARHELPGVLAAIARDAVAAQLALDDVALGSLERWLEDGIPPSGTACTHLRLRCRGMTLGLRRYTLDTGDDR